MTLALKAKQDEFTIAHTQAESYRKKYDGTPDDMTVDETRAWNQALQDADKLEVEISALKLQIARDKREEEVAAIHEIGEAAVTDNPEQDVEKLNDRQIAGVASSALDKFLRGVAVNKDIGNFIREGNDYRGKDLSVTGWTTLEKNTMSLGTPSTGGEMAMPMQWAQEFLKNVDNEVFIRRLATVIPLTEAVSLGAVGMATDVSDDDWCGEQDTIQFTTPALNGRVLQPHIHKKGLKISRFLLKKAPQAGPFAQSRLAYKHGVTQEKAFLTGTGVSQPLGILTPSVMGISTSRDLTSTSALVVSAADLFRMYGNLKPAYWNKAQWLLHRDFLFDLRTMKDPNDNYMWQPFENPGKQLTEGNPGSIIGRPYNVSEYCTAKTNNAWVAGDYAITFGDFSKYWIADSLQFELQMIYEKYADTAEIAMFSYGWVDGQPVLEEAFTRMAVHS